MGTKLMAMVSLALLLGLTCGAGAQLLLNYQFNEGSGMVIHDSVAGNADANMLGFPQWAPGHTGQAGDWAIDFDTDGIGTGYVQGKTDALAAITNKMTVACWIYGHDRLPLPYSDNGSCSQLFAMGGGAVNEWVPYFTDSFVWTCGTGELFVGTLSPYSRGAVPGDGKVTEYKNAWNHWAFEKNTATGVMKVYCNAVLIGIATNKYQPFPNLVSNPFYIGTGYNFSPLRNFAGVIDDFRVYDEELSATDLEAMMGFSPLMAKGAIPESGDAIRARTYDLTWTSGQGAVSHNVYFGENEEDVTNGVPHTFMGNQTANQYTVADLEIGTYYWRIDEVQISGAVTTGRVWRFTTLCIPPYAPAVDLNGDCRVDLFDFAVVASSWLQDQM